MTETATAARPGANTPDGTLLNEMFKSYWRIEDDKNSLRQQHRTKVGKMTEQQGEVKARVKDAGYSLRAFNELLAEEKDRRRIENRKAKLEDDDADSVEAMKAALGAFGDTPLGRAVLAAAGAEDDGEEDLRSPAQKERALRKRQKNSALDEVAGNGAEQLADGIKKLDS